MYCMKSNVHIVSLCTIILTFSSKLLLTLQLTDEHIHVGQKLVAPRVRLILSHKTTLHLLRIVYLLAILILFNCAKNIAEK